MRRSALLLIDPDATPFVRRSPILDRVAVQVTIAGYEDAGCSHGECKEIAMRRKLERVTLVQQQMVRPSGWQRESLIEALGEPDDEAFQPDDLRPSSSLHVMRWRCGAPGLVSAVRAAGEDAYELEVTCAHQEHQSLARLAATRALDVTLLGRGEGAITKVPRTLEGMRLRFVLYAKTRVHCRVEIGPDLEGGPLLSRILHVDCGVHGPGAHEMTVGLDGEKLDKPLLRDVELSIHVLDPLTARRDRGAEGILLWSREYRLGT